MSGMRNEGLVHGISIYMYLIYFLCNYANPNLLQDNA